MKIIILTLTFILISSQTLNITTMNLELNADNFYIIKNIDSNLHFSFSNKSNISLMPIQYTNLIKMILKNKKIYNNCKTIINYKNKTEYQSFFCEKSMDYKDLDLKLYFNFDNFNISLKESELLSKKGSFYYFNFWTNDNISDIVFSNKLLRNDNNNYLGRRKLETEDNNEDNDDTNENGDKNNEDNYQNDPNRNMNKINKKNTKFGWLKICLIILLSIIVIYVSYVVCRYYRRKKYQNPSFYYKITEEMFNDIVPIE